MIVLGIDTATNGLGVALAGPDGTISETTTDIARQHSQGLLPTVEWLLQHSNLTLDDLDAVAVTVGPGSFTAVRIGVNTAKGLCMALDLPLVGFSALEAASGRIPCADRPVAVWFDAKRSEVYSGLYDTSGGHPVSLLDDEVGSPADMLERYVSKTPNGSIFVGDGVDVYRSVIEERMGSTAQFAPAWLPAASAAVVAYLGRIHALAGDTISADDAAPVYLRRPQAVVQRTS
jgi:tRNA threonylcarbamoyladenosine biosynthesis protein TsaB